VTYAYGPERPGIADVTLSVGPGESIGIVGRSGGGKTTLVQVLLRLRLPTSGTVSIDGLPYTEIHPTSWHRLVSMVP
jgi:ATP-binding cassette, subfamily B, bacterial